MKFSLVVCCLALLFEFNNFALVLCQAPGPSSRDRANALLIQMTSAEKYSLLNGINAFQQGFFVGNLPSIPRLNIPSLNLQDGPQGFRTTSKEMYGQVTSWPCSLGVSSTFNSDTVYRWAQAMGAEAKAKGANILLGPAINFHRVPRGGRNGEYLTGESSTLGAIMTKAYVQGIQSNKGIMANIKHFTLNNQETNRNTVNSIVNNNRTLWEVYYPAFQAGINAGASSAMCSYNLVNGVHACSNSKNLRYDLKGNFLLNFTGFIMSDWGAVHDLTGPSSGLDIDMPGDDQFYSPDNLAKVDPATIDDMVFRILFEMIDRGIYDSPVCSNTGKGECDKYLYSTVATSPDHIQLAREIASESAQLLQNNNGVLPLDQLPSGSTIALIGSVCNSTNDIDLMTNQWDLGNYYVLGGSGRVISPNTVSIYTALLARATRQGLNLIMDTSNDVSTSTKLMAQATVSIICGATTSTEGKDRSNLLLDNDKFIDDVLSSVQDLTKNTKMNINTVVIMNTPGVVLTQWRNKTNAIVNMFLAGEQTGSSWSDVLFGEVNPSGKLPVTFPNSEEDTIAPCQNVDCAYDEGLNVGYLHYLNKQVAFPFGHGLSYTSFKYNFIQTPTRDCNSIGISEGFVCMIISISNVGLRDGTEKVQVYLDYPPSSNEPINLLRDIQVVTVKASGQSNNIPIALTSRDFSIWDESSVSENKWQIQSGRFTIHIGSSSRNFLLDYDITI